jgi:hypothetical protein
MDIAPPLLHMVNLPIPADMDGRVIEEMFSGRRSFSKGAQRGERGTEQIE